MNRIFLDRLDIFSFFLLLSENRKTKIEIFQPISNLGKIFLFLLKKMGFRLDEVKFQAGKINFEGDALPHAASRLASIISLELSESISSKILPLKNFNESCKRNEGILFTAKFLFIEIRKYILDCLIAESFSGPAKSRVLLSKPMMFPGSILDHHFKNLQIVYYYNAIEKILLFLRKLYFFVGVAIYFFIKNFLFFSFSKKLNLDLPGIFSFQEESIRSNNDLRSQLHWLDGKREFEFNIFVLLNKKFYVEDEIYENLNHKQIFLLKKPYFHRIQKNQKTSTALDSIRKMKIRLVKGILTSHNLMEFSILIHNYYLVQESIILMKMFLSLNIKLFLVSENYSEKSQAALLASQMLGVKSVSCQYSNLPFLSVPMMTTSDVMVLFGNHYKPLYIYKNISPGIFLEGGYYRNINPSLEEKSQNLNKKIKHDESSLVIGYFDESIEYSKYGLVRKKDHFSDILRLARLVIKNRKYSVIIKSQFAFNNLKKLYPSSYTIQRAIDTGRFIELNEGTHRNDILPFEVALASDLIINHKFGATAAIESALCGKPVILLDDYKAKSITDDMYFQNNVIIGSMRELVRLLESDSFGEKHFGNWEEILKEVISGYVKGNRKFSKIYEIVVNELSLVQGD